MSTILEYKCPCCGGALTFDSTLQKMKCPYCGTEFDVETLRSYDEELREDAQEDEMTWDMHPGQEWQNGETEHMAVYSCQSCGGEIVGDRNMAATSCPYCGNPVILLGQFSGDLRPDYVIPFRLDKEAAKAGLKRHLHGKRLLPKAFQEQNHIDSIRGIYVPFWLFDTDTDSRFRYRATITRTWSDRDYNYVETSYFSVHRAGRVGFERIPVDGSSKMPNDLMESIEPYRFEDAVDFQTAYLAGYLADRYDVTAEENLQRVNERVKNSAEQMFRRTVQGYSSVVAESGTVRLHNGQARYALYPVWILNTTWEGKSYLFAMNGQTGKFVGDLPVDKKAYLRWLAGLFAVCSAVVYGLAWLIHLL